MAPASIDAPAPSRRPGRLSQALIRLWMKQARVVASEPVAADFRLITLESPQFKGLSWTPGQKVQVAMGSAFTARTFTPIDWDAAAGRTRILGYAHGDGPGSAWLLGPAAGDTCDIFGPRASLDTGQAGGDPVVLGDETSFGLAYALSRRSPRRPRPCLFEVNHLGQAQAVLARLDLHEAMAFERSIDDAQLALIEQRLPALIATGVSFVLTGKASTIQRLRRVLKNLEVPGSRLLAKPYWAPGKTGLD